MKGYIYQIINKVDGKRYVGQTIDIERRKKQHLTKLQNNTHPNIKLQQAWNEWGQESFYFDYEEFEDSSVLDKKEIETIEKFDSFKNGYNMTPGGQNGGTRSKLSYSEYCFVYYGCQWQGMTEKIGKYLKVDSACISSILREKSYKNYLEMSKELTQTEIQEIQNHFREVFNIPEDKLPDSQRVPSHLTKEEYLTMVNPEDLTNMDYIIDNCNVELTYTDNGKDDTVKKALKTVKYISLKLGAQTINKVDTSTYSIER